MAIGFMKDAAHRILGVGAHPNYGCTDGAIALKDALLANFPSMFVGNCYAHVNRLFGSGGSIYKVYSAAGKGLVEEAPAGNQAQQGQRVKARRVKKRKAPGSVPAGPSAVQQARKYLDSLANITYNTVFVVAVQLLLKYISEVQQEPAAAALFEKSCCTSMCLCCGCLVVPCCAFEQS